MSWMHEYPRPQLRRDSFYCLNGTWTVNGQKMEVPFPPQSALSGFEGEVPDRLEYTRDFSIPIGFARKGFRIRLHFGAVDQVADVFVNGRFVLRHEGGYLPFYADITDVLRSGMNRLSVSVLDELNHDYPYGKQRSDRGGMWYTPVSGIWQTVWMEAIPDSHVESLRIDTDLSGITLTVNTDAKRCDVNIPGVGMFRIAPNQPVRIDIPDPQLWSPEDPYLYQLLIFTESECVRSYFALRKVEIRVAGGRERIFLNGKPLFINGVLDQGYFPDGIYLPQTPEAFRSEVRRMKELGVNLLRKHCKVEPEAFYHACDTMGMLVMQDMVNSGGYSFLLDTALPTAGFRRRPDSFFGRKPNRRREFFTQHALDTQEHLYNHPSVIAYTIFNEGWGQFDADRHYELLKNTDPSRIYDSTSGWFVRRKSDVDSRHVYFRNKVLKGRARPVLLSECGGYARAIPGHMFNEKKQYGYGTVNSEAELTDKIEQMWRSMVLPSVGQGLCGVIYTQVSDVEDEINGLYTYDREICKVDSARLCALAEEGQALLEKSILQ